MFPLYARFWMHRSMSDVNSVYNKLKDMGVTKDDAKGLVAKLIDFVKGLFE